MNVTTIKENNIEIVVVNSSEILIPDETKAIGKLSMA
jgi:hypothetical protein